MDSIFSLAIVDDEKLIRDGIGSLIDWEQLGFFVSGIFPDGRQCIDWLRGNHVDIVLTDLRMSEVSGLELAAYIKEHCPQTRVVFISGHSDFDAAQMALELNVAAFLLKPISLKRIRQVFRRIHQELTSERHNPAEDALRAEGEQTRYRWRFAQDLINGQLSQEETYNRYMGLLGWKETAQKPAALFCVHVLNYEEALQEFEGKNVLIDFVCSGFQSMGLVMPLRDQDGLLFFIALDVSPAFAPSKDNALCAVKEQAAQMAARLSLVVRLDLAVRDFHSYANLRAVILSLPPSYALSNETVSFATLREQQSLVMTNIMDSDLELAQENFEHFLGGIRGSIPYLKSVCIDFVSGLVEHLRGNGASMEGMTVFNYEALAGANTREELTGAFGQAVGAVGAIALSAQALTKSSVIALACQYIDANYNKDISLELTAAHVFLSPVYLSRLFKEVKGETYINYLIRKRLDRACELLTDESNYSVSHICTMVGYRNVKYFYSLFSKRVGSTPAEYRLLHGKADDGGHEG